MLNTLFPDEIDQGWKEHWKDAPEYICNDLKAKYAINIIFKNECRKPLIISFLNSKDKANFSTFIGKYIGPETKQLELDTDIKSLSELLGQSLTKKTQSVWFPKQEFDIVKNIRWVDAK